MNAFADLTRGLRDLAARRLIYPSDRLVASIRRDGAAACLFKWTLPLSAMPELWPDELPEADSEGIPVHPQHRAILLALLTGPRIVDLLARDLGMRNSARLYDGGGSIVALKEMGLVENGESGYTLTAKGRRVAAAIQAEAEG